MRQRKRPESCASQRVQSPMCISNIYRGKKYRHIITTPHTRGRQGTKFMSKIVRNTLEQAQNNIKKHVWKTEALLFLHLFQPAFRLFSTLAGIEDLKVIPKETTSLQCCQTIEKQPLSGPPGEEWQRTFVLLKDPEDFFFGGGGRDRRNNLVWNPRGGFLVSKVFPTCPTDQHVSGWFIS